MMISSEQKVKRAFPDSEWEWWYVSNSNGTTSYLVIVYTASRTILGQAVNNSLTIARHKAYRKASKYTYVLKWHEETESK